MTETGSLETQYLVSHGKTHCFQFEGDVCVADILDRLQDVEGVPSDQLSLVYGGKILAADAAVPVAPSVVRTHVNRALAGGKGGFGAMLKAMGKMGGKKTENFGACRDLNGRRLRHVNDEIKLQRWQETMAKKREAKRLNMPWDEDEEDEKNTGSTGIANWYLDSPGWAEGVGGAKLTKAMRKKRAAKRTWETEIANAEAAGLEFEYETGKVTAMDTYNKEFCIVDKVSRTATLLVISLPQDTQTTQNTKLRLRALSMQTIFVPFNVNAGDDDWTETLEVGDELEMTLVVKVQGRNRMRAVKAEKLEARAASKPVKDPYSKLVAYKSSDEMANLVAQGLSSAKAAKRAKMEQQATELAQVLPVDMQAHAKVRDSRPAL
jgi:hypothetical protein